MLQTTQGELLNDVMSEVCQKKVQDRISQNTMDKSGSLCSMPAEIRNNSGKETQMNCDGCKHNNHNPIWWCQIDVYGFGDEECEEKEVENESD